MKILLKKTRNWKQQSYKRKSNSFKYKRKRFPLFFDFLQISFVKYIPTSIKKSPIIYSRTHAYLHVQGGAKLWQPWHGLLLFFLLEPISDRHKVPYMQNLFSLLLVDLYLA